MTEHTPIHKSLVCSNCQNLNTTDSNLCEKCSVKTKFVLHKSGYVPCVHCGRKEGCENVISER